MMCVFNIISIEEVIILYYIRMYNNDTVLNLITMFIHGHTIIL